MSFPFFRPGQINLANEFECQKKKNEAWERLPIPLKLKAAKKKQQ